MSGGRDRIRTRMCGGRISVLYPLSYAPVSDRASGASKTSRFRERGHTPPHQPDPYEESNMLEDS